jgi:3-methyladenine DNA glycosylase AlkC
MTEITKRKGARCINEIPPGTLEKLNAGKLETANLVEWLAVDRSQLLQHVLPKLGLRGAIKPTLVEQLAKPGEFKQTQIAPVIAAALLPAVKSKANREKILEQLSAHPSDLVRSWAAYLIGLDEDLNLAEKLILIRRFAADSHFGVREEAWFAVRASIDRELGSAIKLLAKWTKDKDENVRRFASESTRPRGVWCKHIEALKLHPELGLPVLEPLHSDPSKYVRDSVANWINDASKTRPDWAKDICARWQEMSGTKETAYIVNKAMRTIQKGFGR